jgi:multidrug resistance efflux pump
MSGKRWLALIGTLAILAAAAVFTWYRVSSRAEATSTRQAPVEPPNEIVLPVTVRARNVVSVPAPIEGTIEAFHVQIGDQVFESQLLAHIKNTGIESGREEASAILEAAQDKVNRMESAVIEGRLESSRASADASRARGEYERAERTYQRQQMLYREGATPRLTFERAEKDYNTSKSEAESLEAKAKQVEERVASVNIELDNARRQLEEKRADFERASEQAASSDVKSPADGLVVARRGVEGEQVSREVQDLFQIAVDLSILDAVAEPDPSVQPRIHPGQPALLLFAGLTEGVQARVKELKEGKLFLEFGNPGPAVKPGITGQARIRLSP